MYHPNYKPIYAALLAVLLTQNAHADSNKHYFDIPAQSLNQALLSFGKQSGQQLMYSTAVADHLRSRPVQGEFTASEAVNLLLAAAPLQAVATREGTLTLRPKAITAVANETVQQPTTLPTVKVKGNLEYDANDPYNIDYVLPNATIGTKTDTPIMETPLNVQVISKQVLKDQQVISLDQALKNVSGVTTGGGAGNNAGQSFSSITLRGFSTNTRFRNGVRLDNFGGDSATTTTQLANVESIEILKGPAAILYGGVEPGGVVNIVTKQPLNKPYYSAQQQFGSFDLYRTSIDATGPVSSDDTLLYRVNASFQDNNSIVDFIQNRSYFFAPVAKWNISPRTQATFEFEYRNVNFGQNLGFLPQINGKPLIIDRSLNYGEPSPNQEENYLSGFNLSHQFNDNWAIKHQFLFNNVTEKNAFILPNFIASDAPTQSGFAVGRRQTPLNADNTTYSINLDVTGKFDTAFIKHSLLLGGNWVRYDGLTLGSQSGFLDNNISYIDLFNPIHPGTPFSGPTTPFFSSATNNNTYGFYLQDQLKLPWNIHVLAGFRYENISQKPSFGITANDLQANGTPLQTDAVTPRVGVLWQPRQWLSLYGNYIENLGPNNSSSLTVDNRLVPPTAGKQWELGAKTEFYDGRLRLSFAHFDLTKTNIPTTDPLNPFFVVVTGEARSEGWEFDVQGEIAPGWNMIANYANINAKVTKASEIDTFTPLGSPLGEVPTDLGHLFSTYEFQTSELKGLKLGFGATFNGSAPYLFAGNSGLTIPGYITFDLLGAYSFKAWGKKLTAQINATNIFDKTYFSELQNPGYSAPLPYSALGAVYGAPRTVLGSIKIEF